MADAWMTLIANSTIPAGDAWAHLNNQGSGTGTLIVEGLFLDMADDKYLIEVEEQEIVEIGINSEFDITVEDTDYIIEVD